MGLVETIIEARPELSAIDIPTPTREDFRNVSGQVAEGYVHAWLRRVPGMEVLSAPFGTRGRYHVASNDYVGWMIRRRNSMEPHREIDIVARRDGIDYLVEVKNGKWQKNIHQGWASKTLKAAEEIGLNPHLLVFTPPDRRIPGKERFAYRGTHIPLIIDDAEVNRRTQTYLDSLRRVA